MKFTNIFGNDDQTLTTLTPRAINQIIQAFEDLVEEAKSEEREIPTKVQEQVISGKNEVIATDDVIDLVAAGAHNEALSSYQANLMEALK